MAHPQFVAIHIMKTAGTSLRRMLIDGLGATAVHPNDKQLRRMNRGWYPGPADLVDQVRSGAAGTPRPVIGHIPYVLAEEFERRPLTIALLRDPVPEELQRRLELLTEKDAVLYRRAQQLVADLDQEALSSA